MQPAARRRQGISHVLPVVEQNVRSPDLVCGETQVLHPRMFALVPLEVVVEPALKHTQTRTQCGLQRTGEDWCSHYLGLCFTGTRVLMMGPRLHVKQQRTETPSTTSSPPRVLTIRSHMLVVSIWFFSSCKKPKHKPKQINTSF